MVQIVTERCALQGRSFSQPVRWEALPFQRRLRRGPPRKAFGPLSVGAELDENSTSSISLRPPIFACFELT